MAMLMDCNQLRGHHQEMFLISVVGVAGEAHAEYMAAVRAVV